MDAFPGTHPFASLRSEPRSLLPDSWAVPALAAAATLVSIGLSWDISWHMTIGRDTFWTPAHIAIYLGGASGGFICGWLAIRTTYFAGPSERGACVGLWGGYAPFGAWIAIWGTVVPVVAAATQRLAMPAGLEIGLGALGCLLFVAAATLVGRGVRESVLPPGAPLTPAQRRRGYVATALAALALAAALYGGRQWWTAVDRNYRSNEIYRPNPLDATVTGSGDARVLHLDVGRDGNYFRGRLQLIPDHGKLMHLFMIREPGLDALAHLHPVRSGARAFAVQVPPLPDGRYRLYADITYETGFAATLTAAVDLNPGSGAPSTAALPPRDPDDSWHVGGPGAGPIAADTLALTSGPAFRAGEDVSLDFAAADRTGRPVAIEPYMGMLGHAAVRRSDGSVFAHLHPVGTISMASQEYFTERAARETGTAAPMDHSMHLRHGGSGNTVSFPYFFPKPGSYRIWAQTKVDGRVVTGVADVEVSAAGS